MGISTGYIEVQSAPPPGWSVAQDHNPYHMYYHSEFTSSMSKGLRKNPWHWEVLRHRPFWTGAWLNPFTHVHTWVTTHGNPCGIGMLWVDQLCSQPNGGAPALHNFRDSPIFMLSSFVVERPNLVTPTCYHAKFGHTVSKTYQDIGQKSQFFSTQPLFNASPAEGVPLGIGQQHFGT